MGNFFSQAGTLLVETLFSIYIVSVLLRFLFQIVRADFYNPFSQFLVRFTNPPLLPLRRVIPGLGGIDLASVVLLLLLQALKLFLLAAIQGVTPQPGIMLVLAVAQLLQLTLWVFIIAIFIRVLASWFATPYGHNPLLDLVTSLTEPLLRPARRYIPPMSGVDLSPIAVLLILQLLLLLISNLLPVVLGALGSP